jgi:hypothetical protein
MGTSALSQSRAYHAKNHIMNHLGVSEGALLFPEKNHIPSQIGNSVFIFKSIFKDFKRYHKIEKNKATSKFIIFQPSVWPLEPSVTELEETIIGTFKSS